jgi:hypothetical protein
MLNNFSTSITSALYPIHVNYFATAHLCLTVPPPLAALGATALVGDLPPAPTEVELGAGGWKSKTITILKMDKRGEIWWECPYNHQLCWKYSYHFVNLGFELHYTGLKLVQPAKCSTRLFAFHYNASQLTHTQHTPPTSTYWKLPNTSHGNRDTGMIIVQMTNLPKSTNHGEIYLPHQCYC